MIDRIIELSIRRRWVVVALAAFTAIAGVAALRDTPVDAIPDLSENQVMVFTPWEGHGPEEIDQQITAPLSVHLQATPHARVVRGSSDANFSLVHVIFDDGVAVDDARRDVGQRIAAATQALPAGASPYLAPESPATGQVFWYAVEGRGYDLRQLREIQDQTIKPQLNTVEGVAEVASVGGFETQYELIVDPARLQLHNVPLSAVVDAVARSNRTAAGRVLQKGGAEYLVRVGSLLGSQSADDSPDAVTTQVLDDLSNIIVPLADGRSLRLGDLSQFRVGPQPRRGVFEKDGNEVVGGGVSMQFGENPLALTARIKSKIDDVQSTLPAGVEIVAVYDRTPLITGAVRTVTRTLLEAILAATVCVVLVFRRIGISLVIALTLPLACLASFLAMWMLRRLGIVEVQTNIMTLAGLAVSIGVLVDAAIVMAENAVFTLHKRFGNQPVTGDMRAELLRACQLVGRPMFYSMLIMLLSFFPVFALEGAAGKMFRPLAMMKSAALVAAAVLAITVVPACCTLVVRGRLRGERDSWIVRSVMDVYRPLLDYLLSHPMPLVCLLAVTMLTACAAVGSSGLFLAALGLAVIAVGLLSQSALSRTIGVASIVILALIADQRIAPLGRDLMTPLAEGMIMDMPITAPRVSITQTGDDLKARDMALCRFPEVAMVVGKGGRAETPTDPAPLDMIETMVEFRPQAWWPRRKLDAAAARRESGQIFDVLVARQLIEPPPDEVSRQAAVAQAAERSLVRFDGLMREYAYQRNQEFLRELGGRLRHFAVERCLDQLWREGRLLRQPTASDAVAINAKAPAELSRSLQGGPTAFSANAIMRLVGDECTNLSLAPARFDLYAGPANRPARAIGYARMLLGLPPATFRSKLESAVRRLNDDLWAAHVRTLNQELLSRAADAYARANLEEHLRSQRVLDERLAHAMHVIDAWRLNPPTPSRPAGAHVHGGIASPPPVHDAQPLLDELQSAAATSMRNRLWLAKADRHALGGFGGELDLALQMPGWTNVWTMPIQNRVDMLATGVNATVGVRVLGRNLDDVVDAAARIGELVRKVPGAAQVVVDPVRGKGYLDIRVNRASAARHGVSVEDVNQVIEAALGGCLATTTIEGRTRRPVRVRFPPAWRRDETSLATLPIVARGAAGKPHRVTLGEVADVTISNGPAVIKSENGLLRTYVRCNVVGRGALDFVEQARAAVARADLPDGVQMEWTGQFESEARAQSRLRILFPVVLGLIAVILYVTYRDFADAALMMLAVPGALAGGVLFQWLCGFQFSVTVWIGYIACFGMASATAIIMLVYLRESVANAGGVAAMSLAQLRAAVLDGAVHRLRPKLLTEATTIIGLAPMLWASGPGADVIRPMAAPVLGGILVADEVIDLLIPVLFYWTRRRRWARIHGNCARSDFANPKESARGPGPSVLKDDAVPAAV